MMARIPAQKRSLAWLVAAALTPAAVLAAPPQVVPVAAAAKAPAIDGELADWGRDGWIKVAVKPAVAPAERAKLGLGPEDRNQTGSITVEIKALAAGGRLFLAARWPDDAADTAYRGWEWSGARYSEGKARDDMFAVRWHLDGDFDRSMLSGSSYRVDLWLWSAGRSNPLGLAEDMRHEISTRAIEDAAEYAVQGVGTVYIKKHRDAGDPLYKTVRPPKTKGADRLDSFELNPKPAGGTADVQAKGVWKNGFWQLEMARKLDTGNADDRAFAAGEKVSGQIAVFNRASDEHKSVSEPLLFDFSAVR
ncbi:MAG TPA: ethylbenzene dehydrogenase-related protein [Azospira sp.]|nr:ethylbenzene dehydrogenase-related protein [Azospira sp.]